MADIMPNIGNWWDQLTTRMGDALIAPQTPFGSWMGPPAPDQRRQMISNALITLGGNLAAGGAQGQPTMASIGQGFQNLASQGMQRQQHELQGMMLGAKIGEMRRSNQTREALKKNTALLKSMGMTPEMIDMLPPDQIGKVWIEGMKSARMREAYGAGGGDVPTVPTGGAPTGAGGTISADYPHPVEYGYNISNLIGGKTPWEGKGSPYTHPALKGMQFETFADPAQGVAAAYKNIQYHARNSGVRTFDDLGIVLLGGKTGGGHITPGRPDGGKDNSQAWAQAVARHVGLKPGDPLPLNDPQAMARVMEGINIIEHGRRTVPPEAYLAGVTGQRPQAGGAPPQTPTGAPSPVQYTPPGQGPQAPAGGPPQGQQKPGDDPRNDPGLQMLYRSRAQAMRAEDWARVGKIDEAIAKRAGELADRSVTQGNERERIRLQQEQDRRAEEQHRAAGNLVTIDGRHVWRNTIGGKQTDLGSASSPIDREKFRLAQEEDRRATERLGMDRRQRQVQEGNQPVLVDQQGNRTVNPQVQEAEVAKSAAQGENAERIRMQGRAGGVIADKVAGQFAELRDKAASAATEIEAIHAGRQILDSGAFTGLGANQGVVLGRIGEFLGLPSDKAVNSQVFGPVMASRVFALVKNLGSGTGISEGDRKFAAQAAAGEITLDEPAIRRLLDIGERTARGIITKFNKEGEGWRKVTPNVETLPDSVFSVPAPSAYADWAKTNPLAPLQRGAMQGGAGAPQPGPAGGGRVIDYDIRGRRVQ